MLITIDWEATLWTGVEAYCPICKKTYRGWYCPSCGLPKKNSKYASTYYGSLVNCKKYHFRPEFSSFENFKLCDECYTTNPYNAKFCRNCKNKFTNSKGITKDTHGWVDLGLSVLWATDMMKDKFRWMDCQAYSKNLSEKMLDDRFNYKGNKKDAATEIWGHKWRTPTKEEFEELITKCRWERCIDSNSKKYALKATGPNGNSIILTLDSDGKIRLWTSTESSSKYDGKAAYSFIFENDIKIEKSLTAKQKKAIEFQKSNDARFKFDDLTLDLCLADLYLRGQDSRARKWKEEEKRQRYPEYEKTIVQQRKILDAMGDDRQERENNEKKDKKNLDNLWISTPIKPDFIKDYFRKYVWLHILPVADKKWQGEL